MSKSFHYRDNYEHEYRGDSKKKKKQKDKTFQNKLGKSKASSFDLIDSFQRIESLLRVTELVKDESLSKVHIPIQTGQRFQSKPGSDSNPNRAVIPI
jgi:hypothetical protein